MTCEKCGGEMYDNTTNKRNPKYPDYKCKDKGCGHAVWVKKGKAKTTTPKVATPETAYKCEVCGKGLKDNKYKVCYTCNLEKKKTQVEPKEEAPKSGTQTSSQSYVKRDYGDTVPRSMLGAWAMNLVIALVGQGKITTREQALKEYEEIVAGVDRVLNNKVTEPTREAPVTTTEEEIEESEKEEVEEVLNLDDELNLDNINL